MAAFATGATRSLPQRGAAAGLRFFIYAVLAVTLMVLDQRGGWLGRVRYGLQAAAYPLQLAMNSPSAAWNWTSRIFEERAALQAEAARLRDENRRLQLANLRQVALERENGQLRGLRERLPTLASKWLLGEVIGTESSSLRQRLTVNRGAANGVFAGQAVIANAGLLGQTLRVGPWSTEIILVTDPEHAVPVEVARNGLRTLAVGSGDTDSLVLPYLPIQSDIKEGDLLVTSGLGGVFPQGYPVAKVVHVHDDPRKAVLAQQVQSICDQRLACGLQQRLRCVVRQRSQALAFPRSEDHGARRVAGTGAHANSGERVASKWSKWKFSVSSRARTVCFAMRGRNCR